MNVEIQAKFAKKPYRFCVNMGNDASVVRYNNYFNYDKNSKNIKLKCLDAANR